VIFYFIYYYDWFCGCVYCLSGFDLLFIPLLFYFFCVRLLFSESMLHTVLLIYVSVVCY